MKDKIEKEALAAYRDFPSRLSVPPGWRARHRNLKVWRPEPSGNLWLMEPLPENAPLGDWTETDFGSESGGSILYRGEIDFSFRVGTADIQRRPYQDDRAQIEAIPGKLSHSKTSRGEFVDEDTYRLSTGIR